MKLRYMIPTSLILVCGIAAPFNAFADTSGFVKAYGETLDLHQTHFSGSAYTWQQLMPFVPSVLPADSSKISLNPEKICEIFRRDVYNKFAEKADSAASPLVMLTDLARTDNSQNNSELILSEAFNSPSQGPVERLKTALLKTQRRITAEKTFENPPYNNSEFQKEKESQNVVADIVRAKQAAVQSLTAIMLYDATLAKCPKFAANNPPIY